MRNIPISDDGYEKLTAAALAAGFADVSAFIHAMVGEQILDPREPMRDDELAESLSECDQAIADFEGGAGNDAEQAIRDIGRKRGFDLGG